MVMYRTMICCIAAILCLAGIARADDFGPRQDVNEVRADARALLAHRLRQSGIAPESLVVSDVVSVRNDAILSWDAGKLHGFSGFIRLGARWWFALDKAPFGGGGNRSCWDTQATYPLAKANSFTEHYVGPSANDLAGLGFSQSLVAAASIRNADVRLAGSAEHTQASLSPGQRMRLLCDEEWYLPKSAAPINSSGGYLTPWSPTSDGYRLSIRYSANDSGMGTTLSTFERRPTDAELLPYPTPANYSSDAVFYFDLTFDGPKNVQFQPGTTIEVWCPFYLDAALRYNLSISNADKPIGPIYGSLFDNTVHFVLPAFTAMPGKTLMAEIDGDKH